jgi:putative sugar O-methyltransferase
MNVNVYFFFFLVISQGLLGSSAIQENWLLMQKNYLELRKNNEAYESISRDYYHPVWDNTRFVLQNLINSSIVPNLASVGCINANMIRQGFGDPQRFEVLYLQKCISQSTKNMLNQVQDTDFLGLGKQCAEWNCSTNTLGHLFYAARILETVYHTEHATIVELGGGYGNFARIFKQARPDSTFILIDFPEVSALQFFFLKSTLENTKIIFHTIKPDTFEQGAIHILPIYFIEESPVTADIFISTFALSECSQVLQKLIIQKHCFQANDVYISGQFDGGNPNCSFVHHSYLIDSLRKLYQQCICQPFHFWSQTATYEIIAHQLQTDVLVTQSISY